MKNNLFFSLLALIFFAVGCQQKPVENEYNIIPLPNKMAVANGRFDLKNCTIVSTAGCSAEVKALADSLIENLNKTAGITMTQTGEIPEANAIVFVTNKNLPKEGYQLQVTPEKITLTASQPNGFFYGIQSLYQLLPTDIYSHETNRRAEWSVPAVNIEDSPRLHTTNNDRAVA